MPTIIVHTILIPGHTFPFVPVLAELQRRGFTVKLCVDAPSGDAPASIGGIPVRGIRSEYYERLPTRGPRREQQRVSLENLRRSGGAAAARTAQLLADECPDFVVVDPMLWGSMVAAEASNLPWATVAHNPLSIRGRGIDVRGPGLRPTHGRIGRLRDRVVDLGMRVSLSRPLQMLNAVRAAHGLRPLADFRDCYLTPPLIIAATAEPFEYPRDDWPGSIVFVGPLTWDPDVAPPSWLERLDERPLVVLAGSTVAEYKTSGRWIQVAFDALASEPVQVVATLPIDDLPRDTPPNVFVTRFVSHRHVLRRAACVICHGGHGITTKALSAGVPVVAIPCALDRFEVARRVEAAGAGAMLLNHRLTPERLRGAVRRAIGSREGAVRIAAVFRRAGGAAAAATAIQTLLGTYPARRTARIT
jgi:MGT family glycosyltransferase